VTHYGEVRQAGVALPDGGTPAEWVDALGTRLADLELISLRQ
jgi:hypothetical protein